jgi:putative ABC transport system permease protein
MIRNYFQIALRNFRKNFFFSVANIFGLTIGLTCCMLIAIYLYHEFTYDHHHQKIDRLYKVATTSIIQDKEENGLATPSPVGPALQKEFPEIEGMARSLALFIDDKTLLQYKKENENKSFYETNGYLADSSFFRLFDYDFAEGNSFSALNEPNSIVISNEIAQKLFGNGSAINRVIHINSSMNGSADYKITGVFKPKQQPTHIDARFFLSMSSGNIGNFVKQVNDFATNNMFNTYILLKPGRKGRRTSKKVSRLC